jgi:hypothetical protein
MKGSPNPSTPLIAGLYQLGLKLMEKAEIRPNPLVRARKFRSGIIISFLALRPLRMRDLTAIALDRHLQLRGERYLVHFESDETRVACALDFPWPESLHRALSCYLKVHRPVLVEPLKCRSDDRLWAMSSGSVYRTIVNCTTEQFAKPVSPQLVRHAAATLFASKM